MNSLLLVLKKIVFLGKTQGLQGDGSYCFQFVLRMSFEDYKFKEGLKLIYLCFFFYSKGFKAFTRDLFRAGYPGLLQTSGSNYCFSCKAVFCSVVYKEGFHQTTGNKFRYYFLEVLALKILGLGPRLWGRAASSNPASVFLLVHIWSCSGFTEILTDLHWFNSNDWKSHVYLKIANIHADTH